MFEGGDNDEMRRGSDVVPRNFEASRDDFFIFHKETRADRGVTTENEGVYKPYMTDV